MDVDKESIDGWLKEVNNRGLVEMEGVIVGVDDGHREENR